MKILIVEDSLVESIIISEMFKDKGTEYDLTILNDGQKAMDFLNKEKPFQNTPLPDLVVLDLNLPKKNGFDILVEMKQKKSLSDIKTVILTSSENDADKFTALRLGATEYFIKPYDFPNYMGIIDRMVSLVA